jgi:hypothetical protein
MSQEIIRSLKIFMGRSYEEASKRNRIVHDPWYAEAVDETTAQLRAAPRGELGYGFTDVTEADVKVALNDIRAFYIAATKLRQAVLAEFRALSKKLAEPPHAS